MLDYHTVIKYIGIGLFTCVLFGEQDYFVFGVFGAIVYDILKGV